MARYVHKRIKKIAVEMAHAYYEDAARNNTFYKFYPDAAFFVKREWKRFVLHARNSLVDCLKSNQLNETQKEEIMDVLLLDRSLPQGVAPTAGGAVLH